MKKIAELSKTLFVSPEFFLVVLFLVGRSKFFHLLQQIHFAQQPNSELKNYLLAIPTLIFVWQIKMVKPMLFPTNDTENILASWPDFWKLKITMWVAVTYSLIGAVGFFSVFLMDLVAQERKIGYAIFYVAIELIAAGTTFNGEIELNELLKKSKK